MLRMDGITLAYRQLWGRRVEAVTGFSLTLGPGEIHAIVGPNGTGKTSLVRAAAGTLQPIAGTVRLFGQDPVRAGGRLRRRLGILLDGARYLHARWTGWEMLLHQAALYGVRDQVMIDRLEPLWEGLALAPVLDEPIFRLSRGMRQKLCLLLTLLHDPDVLILDEPTLGLDATGIAQVRSLLVSLRQAGKSVLLTSHDLDLLEEVSDGITVMAGGRVRYRAAPTEILRWAAGGYTVTMDLRGAPPGLADRLPAGAQLDGDRLTLPLGTELLSQTLVTLSALGVEIASLRSNCTLETAMGRLGLADGAREADRPEPAIHPDAGPALPG
ncbi:MAG TPA: ABC transporter ATP-binding protein [Symbiobacteriaceae bacterium]|nr:ABC transporter ATP-binding protein [Symbiobacteriaceae bacterium]